jgi:hypothetical protein
MMWLGSSLVTSGVAGESIWVDRWPWQDWSMCPFSVALLMVMYWHACWVVRPRKPFRYPLVMVLIRVEIGAKTGKHGRTRLVVVCRCNCRDCELL